jgi:hypothetical protein
MWHPIFEIFQHGTGPQFESRLFLNEAMLIPWASAESAVDQKAFVSGLLWLFTLACVEALY